MCARSNCLTIASTRLRVSHGGFGSRRAKNLFYWASTRLISLSSRCRSRSTVVGWATCLLVNEEVEQRQPELPRIGHRAIVDEDLRVVRRPDDFEQAAQPRRAARPETGAVPVRSAAAGLAKLGRIAREFQRARELRGLEVRKHDRDRKRPLAGAEQRVVQVGIERSELLGGWLLGEIRVRPKPLERTEF